MRKLVYLVLTLFAFAACSEKGTPEEEAVKAAKKYYEYILEGEYDKYIEGICRYDSIPKDYKKQLITSVKQYMHTQEKEHGGIREVRAVKAEKDSLRGYTNAFLVLCFGDSVNEEVVVPMIEHDGTWRIR